MLGVVVVDPMSTGATVAERLQDRGFKVIRLWSHEIPEELKSHIPKNQREGLYAATVEHEGDVNALSLARTSGILSSLPYEISEIICGSEPGVTLTNALTEYMGFRGNASASAEARSNKFHQSEAVRQAGLRAVQQALVYDDEGVREFIARLSPSPFRVIVKPVASAGSEDVKLCYSEDEVFAHVRHILGKEFNALGRKNTEVLVQVYLSGTEYVVDFVSRDGVHKNVAVWEYDKREANGGSAVYFGERPISGDSELAVRMRQYVAGVLDAIGITNGSTHSEVIVDAAGVPCLVECNCRTNGGDGLWVPLMERLYGYSQVSALLDAYFDGEAFSMLPDSPTALTRQGVVGHIVSYQEGTMLKALGLKRLEALSSHIGTALCLNEGDHLTKTIDFMTDAGVFLLVNDDPQQLEDDYTTAHNILARGDFFAIDVAKEKKGTEDNTRDEPSTDASSDNGSTNSESL